MKIGGFQKLSLIDYPGKLSSIVFTVGCNLRCPFCYVPQLVLSEKAKDVKLVPEEEVFSYLKSNKDLIDAVVITGGEPTLQEDIVEFAKKIKDMGFLVAIETNGTNYEKLKELIDKRLVDYVAVDVKTVLDFDKYKEVTGGKITKVMLDNIKKSIEMLKKSNIDYEFRTTLVKEFHSKDTVKKIVESVKGAKNYYLQNFKSSEETISEKTLTPLDDKEIEEIVESVKDIINIIAR